jgi:hypothetical protein
MIGTSGPTTAEPGDGIVREMRVLMLESHPGVGRDAEHALTDAGHSIVRCDTADRCYPCVGLAPGGACPLDQHVDVAVLAQELGSAHLEHGALCAARARVPIVEVGTMDPVRQQPIATWTHSTNGHLLDECERAARDGRAHAEAVVGRLLDTGVLWPIEVERGIVAITVERQENRLLMTIELSGSARPRRSQIVRAATEALRRFDSKPGVIDIAVRLQP